MMAVTLINVFSVPKGTEDEFVKWWQDVTPMKAKLEQLKVEMVRALYHLS